MEALGLDNEEPSLRDAMKILGNINTKLAAHEARMDDISSNVIALGVVANVQPGLDFDTAEKGCPTVAVQDNRD